MAITVQDETTASLDLAEYLGRLDNTVTPGDLDRLVTSAVLLKQLANNRTFLVEHVNKSLLNWKTTQNNVVGDTSFYLARSGSVCVRANVWVPPSSVAANGRWQANLASYLTPHDHPFSFATVGYYGPGYTTTIFEYDRKSIRGQRGEHVDLHFLETTTLPEGKVMIYRACKDVHYQAHPERFSVSLNLMVFPREDVEQYAFDIEHSRVSDSAMTPRHGQMLLCTLAGVLGDGRTSNVLEEVIHTSPDETVRLSAFTAWSSLEQTSASDIWATALCDPHESIRARAKNELETINQIMPDAR
jgi:hypothetical protein